MKNTNKQKDSQASGSLNEQNNANTNPVVRSWLEGYNALTRDNAERAKTIAPSLQPQKSYYTYKWDDGLSSDWNFGLDTYADRLSAFATALSNNISKAIERNNAGDIVLGMSKSKAADFDNASRNLQTFLSNLNIQNGTYMGLKLGVSAIKDLARIASTVGVDANKFKAYFEDYIPKESATTRNLRARRDEGLEEVAAADLGYNQDILNYLTKNKVKLMRDADNNIFAFNENYSQVKPLEYINTDWRVRGLENSPYNWGIFTDANGKVWYGNTGNLSADEPLYETITNTRNKTISDRSNLFTIYNNFDPNLNYTGDSKTIYDFVHRLGAASNITHSLNNFADVSQLFEGNKPVIAVNPDGSAFNLDASESGTLEFSPGTELYYLGNDNTLHKTTWNDPQLESKIGRYRSEGWGEDSNLIGSKLKGLDLGETTITSDLVKDPQNWANRMLDILTKSPTQRTSSDIKELEKYGSFGNPKNILSYIGALLKDGSIKLEGDYLKKWQNKTKEYGTPDLVIITTPLTNLEQDLKLLEEANKAGYSSVSSYLENQRKGFSTTEWMRLGALAADIASLGASFAPGAGTIASGVLGVGASGTDFTADIMLDGFLWKDLGRLGVNLGLDVVGLLPGGKYLKITKNAGKILSRSLPMLIGLWGAFAEGDKYIAAAQKLINGDPKNMTALDWQTLGRGLMLLTGGARTVKATSGAYKSAGRAIKSGAQWTYNKAAEPFKHSSAVRKRAKNISEINANAPAQRRFNAEVSRGTEGDEMASGISQYWRSMSSQALSLALAASVVPITNKDNFKEFVTKLRLQNPAGYLNALKNKGFMELSKEQYKFKQGGQLDRFGEYLKSHK